jgi:hypothetical protein
MQDAGVALPGFRKLASHIELRQPNDNASAALGERLSPRSTSTGIQFRDIFVGASDI